MINNGHADSTPIQVVCNYYYSAILTRSGDVYIVYPFEEYVRKEHEKHCEESETGLKIEGNRISCKTWKLKYDLYKLPQIGDLPELNQRDRSPGSNSPPKIIKIAAMYDRLFGITDDGHILSITGVRSRAEIMNEHWTYVIILHIFFRYPKLIMIIFTVQRGWYSKKRMGNTCMELSMISSHQIIIILLTFK